MPLKWLNESLIHEDPFKVIEQRQRSNSGRWEMPQPFSVALPVVVAFAPIAEAHVSEEPFCLFWRLSDVNLRWPLPSEDIVIKSSPVYTALFSRFPLGISFSSFALYFASTTTTSTPSTPSFLIFEWMNEWHSSVFQPQTFFFFYRKWLNCCNCGSVWMEKRTWLVKMQGEVLLPRRQPRAKTKKKEKCRKPNLLILPWLQLITPPSIPRFRRDFSILWVTHAITERAAATAFKRACLLYVMKAQPGTIISS